MYKNRIFLSVAAVVGGEEGIQVGRFTRELRATLSVIPELFIIIIIIIIIIVVVILLLISVIVLLLLYMHG
jgi:hypothetical protein